MLFFQAIVIVCMRINLINLSKQPFIIKARNYLLNKKKSLSDSYDYAENRPYHSLKLITDSFTDFANASFTAIYNKCRFRHSLKLKRNSFIEFVRVLPCHFESSFPKNRLPHIPKLKTDFITEYVTHSFTAIS